MAYEEAQAGKNMPGRCPWHNRNFSTGSVSIDTVWSAHHTDFAMGEIGMAAMRANNVGAFQASLVVQAIPGVWIQQTQIRRYHVKR